MAAALMERTRPRMVEATDHFLEVRERLLGIAGRICGSRAEAEDAAELVAVEWRPLPAVGDQLQAIAPGAPVIHAELGDNIAFDFSLARGDPENAFADADLVIEEELRFERQMAMTLETRGLIADFDPADGSLTVVHAHQSPFQMQEIYSRQLNIPEHKIRVTAPDIGGGFGMKLNVYSDEIATVVASILLGRPASLDLFADLPATGNFILVSAVDGATVAGGVITWAQAGSSAVGDNIFVLDRELLARGLCSDLGDSPADLAEFHRRAQEAAILLRSVGIPVLIEI